MYSKQVQLQPDCSTGAPGEIWVSERCAQALQGLSSRVAKAPEIDCEVKALGAFGRGDNGLLCDGDN